METRTLILMAAAVIASGCAHPASPGTGSPETGKGLVVSEFRISDQQMTPGQSAIIRLRLKNYHTGEISIEDVSLYNTGFLEVNKNSCSPGEIQPARKGFAPEMECTWIVNAPEDLEGFESKAVTLQLNLNYSSQLDNRQSPMKVQFEPLENIERREEKVRSFSNGEVKATVSYENPVPMEGGLIEFGFQSIGPGRVTTDYQLEYQPPGVFGDCAGTAEAIVGQEARLSCDIVPATDAASQRNLVFSTSYKYVKSPSLDIEVVKP